MTQQEIKPRRFIITNYELTSAGQIITINNKIPNHIANIKTISTFCIPKTNDKIEKINIGELSLLTNRKSNHIIHKQVSPTYNAQDFIDNELEISTQLEKGAAIEGYYKDNNIALTKEGEFIPYTLQITYGYDLI